jgi:hypothetical protein
MDKKPLIVLFEENELNVSILYHLYAEKIPHKSSFWERLSKEELSHAEDIGTQKESYDAIAENKFSRGVAKYIMDFVLEEIERTRIENITHRDALLTALRIEQSMLEKKCFDMFMPTSVTVKELLFKINRETERHVQVLLDEVKRNKFSLK